MLLCVCRVVLHLISRVLNLEMAIFRSYQSVFLKNANNSSKSMTNVQISANIYLIQVFWPLLST